MGLSRRQSVLVGIVAVVAVLSAGTGNLAYIAGRLTMAVAVTLVAMRAWNHSGRGATTA